MRVLALETSTEYCSVALLQDGVVTGRSELAGQKHSEILMGMLDALLKETGVKLAQLDGIAFGMGRVVHRRAHCLRGDAGSGVRRKPSGGGVCTLQALAEASGRPRVIAALDARMGEIYHASYEKQDGAWIAVSEPCLCKPEDASPVPGDDWFGAGSGFAMHGKALSERYAGQLQGMDGAAVPQAAAIAALGATQFAQGRGVDAAGALPLYLRDKVALKTSEREVR